MAFLRKFSEAVSSTVSSLANKVNLDNLIEEEDRKAAGAPAAEAPVPVGKQSRKLPPIGPEYADLNFTYITDNVIGEGGHLLLRGRAGAAHRSC